MKKQRRSWLKPETPTPQGQPHEQTGLALIAKERKRQIESEGWSAEHDDQHLAGVLSVAAACYAIPEGLLRLSIEEETVFSRLWPFDISWWKPSADRMRNLVKAGALIAAEIDRILRAKRVPLTPPPETTKPTVTVEKQNQPSIDAATAEVKKEEKEEDSGFADNTDAVHSNSREQTGLLPCPFCGDEHITVSEYDTKDYWWTQCDNIHCGAEGPPAKTESGAIAQWNRRVASQSTPSQAPARRGRIFL